MPISCLNTALQGNKTLVINAESADIIASLITLKNEVESLTGTKLRFTIVGGTEAHLLAKELAEANVGVIVNPSRPFPSYWEKRRM